MDEGLRRILIENIATIVAVTGLLGAVVLGPIGRAIARRIEGRPAGAEDVRELHARLAQLERGQHEIGELQERLDFTERLLARQTETARLTSGDASR